MYVYGSAGDTRERRIVIDMIDQVVMASLPTCNLYPRAESRA